MPIFSHFSSEKLFNDTGTMHLVFILFFKCLGLFKVCFLWMFPRMMLGVFIYKVVCCKDWRPEQKHYRAQTCRHSISITAKFTYLVLSETGLEKEFNWISETSGVACQVSILHLNFWGTSFWHLNSFLY